MVVNLPRNPAGYALVKGTSRPFHQGSHGRRSLIGMDSAIHSRLGLGVPHEWWPSARLLKSYEAAGFALVQVASPPESVLLDARQLSRHGDAL
jgi:hypothetical protein